MKTIIASVAIAGLLSMTACNNSAVKEKDAAIQSQRHTIDSINTELSRKRVIDSMNEVARIQYVIPQQATPAAQPQTAAAPVVASSHHAVHHHYPAHSTSSATGNSDVAQAPVYQQPAAVEQQPAPVEQKKKGWSAKAKGALIGAGAGAAAGALINGRNRTAGAVIGGITGAAVGTGTGAVIDKKKGR